MTTDRSMKEFQNKFQSMEELCHIMATQNEEAKIKLTQCLKENEKLRDEHTHMTSRLN